MSLACFTAPALASSYVQILQGDLLTALRAEKEELAKMDPGLARRITNRRPVSREDAKEGATPTYASLPSEAELAALPTGEGDAEFKCMTEALYFEARGESVEGLFAVAEVIINRKNSRQFPSSICGVINQGAHRSTGCQFSYKCDGAGEVFSEREAYSRVSKVAELALSDAVPTVTEGALYYHTNYVSPRWSRQFEKTATIGIHYFYRPGS
ncbi:MAG: cell wall hydrolase [Pseudomonadota bacterium]